MFTNVERTFVNIFMSRLRACLNIIRCPMILPRHSSTVKRAHIRVQKPKVFNSRIRQSASQYYTESKQISVADREGFFIPEEFAPISGVSFHETSLKPWPPHGTRPNGYEYAYRGAQLYSLLEATKSIIHVCV